MTFRIGWVWVRWTLVWSTSSQPIFGPICLSCKTKQLCRKFWIEYGSFWVNSNVGLTFGWTYFRCRVGYGSQSFDSDFECQVGFARTRERKAGEEGQISVGGSHLEACTIGTLYMKGRCWALILSLTCRKHAAMDDYSAGKKPDKLSDSPKLPGLDSLWTGTKFLVWICNLRG